MTKKNINVIGLLGPTLDRGKGEGRWDKWRPTVAACLQDGIAVARYDILYQRQYGNLLKQVVQDIAEVSPDTMVVTHQVSFKDPWDFEEVFTKLHDFSKQFQFNTEKTDYLVNITTGTHVAQICLFLLTESKYIPGQLYQLGVDAENKKCGTARVIDLDLAQYDPIAARFMQESQESQDFLKAGIKTLNPQFNKLIERMETVAVRSQAPILLTGDTGVGKTELARRIYSLKHLKHQVSGKFVEVNCATLKGDAAMSMLFGHKKGSFTGAIKDRSGVLQEADGGILFLDEIGELGLDEQAMLLRAIEEKRFLPMGSDKEASSNFQLIAGTNRDLQTSVSAGEFREDLYCRINLWTFKIPSLRERREDIAPNIDFELEKYSEKNRKKVRFSREALTHFTKFATSPDADWCGNFRDLNAAITRLGTMANSGKISTELVEEEIDHLKSLWRRTSGDQFPILHRTLDRDRLAELDLFEKIQLEGVLATCASCNSLADAGKVLFDVSREKRSSKNDSDRIKKFLDKYGLSSADVFK